MAILLNNRQRRHVWQLILKIDSRWYNTEDEIAREENSINLWCCHCWSLNTKDMVLGWVTTSWPPGYTVESHQEEKNRVAMDILMSLVEFLRSMLSPRDLQVKEVGKEVLRPLLLVRVSGQRPCTAGAIKPFLWRAS